VNLQRAMADDFRLLACLHDREPTAAQLEELRAYPMADYLGLRLVTRAGISALETLDNALASFGSPPSPAELDALAVDYADIYLTHRCRAAPSESVWTNDEQLERQDAMFAVRAWYGRHGLRAEGWARRPDDHLVTELAFTAHLLRELPAPVGMIEAAHFLDRHLLRWAAPFFRRVAERCATPYFMGLAGLSEAYLDEARDMIEAVCALPRPTIEASKASGDSFCATPFVPGAGPGW
jgi:TorA maturation chaperone TorD